MRVTIVTCDRCGVRIHEENNSGVIPKTTEPGKMRSGQEFDLCDRCGELFRGMRWGPEGDQTSKLLATAQTQLHHLRGDLRYIREILPDALIAWTEGKDEDARELIRKAAARASSQT